MAPSEREYKQKPVGEKGGFRMKATGSNVFFCLIQHLFGRAYRDSDATAMKKAMKPQMNADER